jgi:hypothetical protein
MLFWKPLGWRTPLSTPPSLRFEVFGIVRCYYTTVLQRAWKRCLILPACGPTMSLADGKAPELLNVPYPAILLDSG